ncbi:RtcB family protein [Arthrobacter sp. 18067]|uniref:RtcB family protein n=1 Tax=Arthrobacter sp. 18067 TaxID=2681413 RepID=UPI00135C2105|nr:RtcB family protein [Arthrobacter sp. 18067]
MPEHLIPKLVNYASILGDNTREQAIMTAGMPFIHPHLALMPDAHLGKGATVGSVIPTLGAIMPAAVGVDIGCGMDAMHTGLNVTDLEGLDRAKLRRVIEEAIPLSAGKYNRTMTPSAEFAVEWLEETARELGVNPDGYAANWRLQLGSLGSGNHFIEVSLDQNDDVWLFLHSGSRGVGNKIAQHHIKVAQDYCAQHFINLPHRDLAYLVEGSEEFQRYINDLKWAQEFARFNRKEMMTRVVLAFNDWAGVDSTGSKRYVTCHHNYTEQERHFGKDVWLSRKGAIDASEGAWGLIPGSMGDKSYVVVGKGSKLSLNSAPHGAGREHSRSAARKLFTQDDLRDRMAGIEYKDSAEFIDEHPAAYKPIDQVMEDAESLVEIKYTLRQIINVKGD